MCCKQERAANSSRSTMTSNSFLQQHKEEEQVLAVPHEEEEQVLAVPHEVEEQVLAVPHGGSLESSAPMSSSACNASVN